MEYAKEKLKADLTLLKQALETLRKALKEPFTDIVRDAVIQRFEYVFELSWKAVQAAAQYMGVPSNSPRESIKAAFKLGWIQDQDADPWFEALEARNKTSHTYNAKLAEEVYQVASKFPTLVQALVASLEGI